MRRIRPVVLVEHTAATQRNTHRLEIVRSYGIAKSSFAAAVVVFLKFDSVYLGITAQRQLVGESRGSDAGHLTDRVECLRKKLMPGCIVVEAMAVVLHLHGEQVRGVEPRVHGKQPLH